MEWAMIRDLFANQQTNLTLPGSAMCVWQECLGCESKCGCRAVANALDKSEKSDSLVSK